MGKKDDDDNDDDDMRHLSFAVAIAVATFDRLSAALDE